MKNKKSIDPFTRFIILSIISCNCGCIVGLLIFKASTTPCKPIPDTVYIEVYKQKSDWELLKTAIIWQESRGNPKAIGGNGYGLYQITPIYVKECNRILGYDKYKHIDAFVDSTANDMFEVVQSYHNTEKCVKKAIKLHNRGDKYYQEVMDKFRMLKFNQYKD